MKKNFCEDLFLVSKEKTFITQAAWEFGVW